MTEKITHYADVTYELYNVKSSAPADTEEWMLQAIASSQASLLAENKRLRSALEQCWYCAELAKGHVRDAYPEKDAEANQGIEGVIEAAKAVLSQEHTEVDPSPSISEEHTEALKAPIHTVGQDCTPSKPSNDGGDDAENPSGERTAKNASLGQADCEGISEVERKVIEAALKHYKNTRPGPLSRESACRCDTCQAVEALPPVKGGG